MKKIIALLLAMIMGLCCEDRAGSGRDHRRNHRTR